MIPAPAAGLKDSKAGPGRDVNKDCQIFLGTKYQNGKKYTKLTQNISNDHKIFPMALK
jgi:hypothetical protein